MVCFQCCPAPLSSEIESDSASHGPRNDGSCLRVGRSATNWPQLITLVWLRLGCPIPSGGDTSSALMQDGDASFVCFCIGRLWVPGEPFWQYTAIDVGGLCRAELHVTPRTTGLARDLTQYLRYYHTGRAPGRWDAGTHLRCRTRKDEHVVTHHGRTHRQISGIGHAQRGPGASPVRSPRVAVGLASSWVEIACTTTRGWRVMPDSVTSFSAGAEAIAASSLLPT